MLAEIEYSDRLLIFRNECLRLVRLELALGKSPVSGKTDLSVLIYLFTATIIIYSLVDLRLNGSKANRKEVRCKGVCCGDNQ